MRILKDLIRSIFGYIVKPEYRFMGPKNYALYTFFQKILRVNSHVPWPVHWSSVVSGPQHIVFAREINPLGYSPGSYIQASNGIYFGSNIIHAVGLVIVTANHEMTDFRKHTVDSPVRIGDNCWFGANVTILPGVEIGNHTIVASGSVVNKSFIEGDCIIGGIPAKVIKKIDKYNGKHYFLDINVVDNIIGEDK